MSPQDSFVDVEHLSVAYTIQSASGRKEPNEQEQFAIFVHVEVSSHVRSSRWVDAHPLGWDL